MLMRILAIGLIAGSLAGVLASGLQHVTTTPLILKAEAYEKPDGSAEGAHRHSRHEAPGAARLILIHTAPPASDAKDEPAVAEWAPADGLERTAYTMLATVGVGVGFALMLLAAMIAAGTSVTPRSGLAWAAGAFIATGLAPALGLPPELPGSAAADVASRQIWWVATVAATAGGLWLMLHRATPAAIALGVGLLVLPHLVGAPHPVAFESTAPAELAGQFAAAALVVHAVLWSLVGAFVGVLWQRGHQRTFAS